MKRDELKERAISLAIQAKRLTAQAAAERMEQPEVFARAREAALAALRAGGGTYEALVAAGDSFLENIRWRCGLDGPARPPSEATDDPSQIAACPICERPVLLTSQGTFVTHWPKEGHRTCGGSGKTAKAAGEAALDDLLRFIRGEGAWAMFGRGIHTHPTGDARNVALHKGCLELERRGLVYRHLDGPDHVVWLPVECAGVRTKE